MIVLPSLLLVASATTLQVTGQYLRYEGAEYESAFIPCGRKEVWDVSGGPALENLIRQYRAAPQDAYGGVMVTLKLRVTPTDKREYPNSHYKAEADVYEVVQVGAGVVCPGSK
jgi:hypothetical protein